jgi:hypothetical protein
VRYDAIRREQTVALRLKGAGIWDIARRLSIGMELVSSILREPESAAALERGGREFLETVRETDDVRRPWRAVQLFIALGLDRRSTAALERYYSQRRFISLENLLDLVLPDLGESTRFPAERLPTCHVRLFGALSHAATVARLRDVELGEEFGWLLGHRLARFIRCVTKTNIVAAFRRYGLVARGRRRPLRAGRIRTA